MVIYVRLIRPNAHKEEEKDWRVRPVIQYLIPPCLLSGLEQTSSDLLASSSLPRNPFFDDIQLTIFLPGALRLLCAKTVGDTYKMWRINKNIELGRHSFGSLLAAESSLPKPAAPSQDEQHKCIICASSMRMQPTHRKHK